jgi:hypothetical protein
LASFSFSNTLEKLSDSELFFDRAGSISTDSNNICCLRCLDFERKNEELEEALSHNTKFVPGDTFSKFQSDKEFRFSLKILDIKKYMTRNRIEGINVHEIWIIAKVDMEKGLVISASIDGLVNDNAG